MALSNIQSVVLEVLALSPLRERFYWTGGTLLAEKYLHHRRSYDIDLFTPNPFQVEEILPLMQSVKEHTGLAFVEQQKVHNRWEFFLHNHEEVRCDFARYEYPALRPREEWMGVLVDSLEDIGANKVIAAVDRTEPKDVLDVYFLLTKASFTAGQLLAFAKEKFGVMMDEQTFMGELLSGSRGLARLTPLLYGSEEEQQQTINEVREYFEKWSAERLHQQIFGDESKEDG